MPTNRPLPLTSKDGPVASILHIAITFQYLNERRGRGAEIRWETAARSYRSILCKGRKRADRNELFRSS